SPGNVASGVSARPLPAVAVLRGVPGVGGTSAAAYLTACSGPPRPGTARSGAEPPRLCAGRPHSGSMRGHIRMLQHGYARLLRVLLADGPFHFGWRRSRPSANPDLEQLRPELPGDEQPIVFGVVSDSVEDRVGVRLDARGQAPEIDPADDAPRVRRDARDQRRAPHVSEDLALDVFEVATMCARCTAERARHVRA